MKKLHKILLLLLMLILPVQGMTAVFASLHRAMDTQSAAMPCHEILAAHSEHQSTSDTNDAHGTNSTHDGDTANHLCCHQVFSYTQTHVLHAGARKFSDVSRFVLPLATLYIPDSPDRPPRG